MNPYGGLVAGRVGLNANRILSTLSLRGGTRFVAPFLVPESNMATGGSFMMPVSMSLSQ